MLGGERSLWERLGGEEIGGLRWVCLVEEGCGVVEPLLVELLWSVWVESEMDTLPLTGDERGIEGAEIVFDNFLSIGVSEDNSEVTGVGSARYLLVAAKDWVHVRWLLIASVLPVGLWAFWGGHTPRLPADLDHVLLAGLERNALFEVRDDTVIFHVHS